MVLDVSVSKNVFFMVGSEEKEEDFGSISEEKEVGFGSISGGRINSDGGGINSDGG